MLSTVEFRLFRDLVHRESGIYLKQSRIDFLDNRVVKRIKATGTNSPYWYYKLLEKEEKELAVLLDLVAIHETSFFRNRPQMDLFKHGILPALLRKNGSDSKMLRIWSAGCSTGEEAYSIAMVILETIPAITNWDIKIFASDLSLNSLEFASKGIYESENVYGTADDHYIKRYFKEDGDKMLVKEEVKKLVTFDYHNLKHENGLTDLDIIFCRNVMIYFDADEQKKLIDKFYRSLNPGGYLLLGHSESLQGTGTEFKFQSGNNATAYSKPFKISGLKMEAGKLI